MPAHEVQGRGEPLVLSADRHPDAVRSLVRARRPRAAPRRRAGALPREGHFFFRRRVRETLAQLAGPVSAEGWKAQRADLGARGRLSA
jgi:hypothetical protein